MPVTLVTKSLLSVPADDIWNRITNAEGINDELRPLMRMTVPEGLKGKSIHDLEVGKHICRSWFLLFGFIPFDYDDIVIAEIEHGRRFLESSSMFTIRTWEHERTLQPVAEGTEVTDRVTFELRPPFSSIPGIERFVASILTFLFKHRHRRLKHWFANRTVPKSAAKNRQPGEQ